MEAVIEPAIDQPLESQPEGMSLAEFLALDERTEFIHGKTIPKLAHLFEHDELLQLLFYWLSDYIRPRELGTVYTQGMFVMPDTIKKDWVKGSRIPDLAVFAGTRMACA